MVAGSLRCDSTDGVDMPASTHDDTDTTDTRDPLTALRGQLQSVLVRELDSPELTVEDLRRIPAGASRQTMSFTATHDGRNRHLVARLELPGAYDDSSLSREAELMRAAHRVGVPSPEVLAYSDGSADHDFPDPYVIMDYIDGESIARPILRDAEYAQARASMAAQCGEILARIHSIDPSSINGLPAPDELEQFQMQLDRAPKPLPTFELALRWLHRNRPAPSGHTLVHGDFRLGNFLVGHEGIRAVLDWELAHVGDPLEDLGWLCVKAWRFGGSKPVGGVGEIDDLVDAYEQHSGRSVDRDALAWWQVLGTLKWGLICVHQTQRHRSGVARSVELATIGRRVSENEWELLELLGAAV